MANAVPFEAVALRDAVEGDVAALVSLLRRSWLVTWAPALPFEAVQAFTAADPARLYAESMWPHFLLAMLNGALAGMAQVADDRLENLHVDPDIWGRGVGSRLLEAAEHQIARTHFLARLEVRAFNRRARAFYGRRGWVEMRCYPETECGSPVENVEMQKAF